MEGFLAIVFVVAIVTHNLCSNDSMPLDLTSRRVIVARSRRNRRLTTAPPRQAVVNDMQLQQQTSGVFPPRSPAATMSPLHATSQLRERGTLHEPSLRHARRTTQVEILNKRTPRHGVLPQADGVGRECDFFTRVSFCTDSSACTCGGSGGTATTTTTTTSRNRSTAIHYHQRDIRCTQRSDD